MYRYGYRNIVLLLALSLPYSYLCSNFFTMAPKAPKAKPKPKGGRRTRATTGPCLICDQPWHLIAECSVANSGRAGAEAALARLAPGMNADALKDYIGMKYPQDQSDQEEQAQEHNQVAQGLAQQYNLASAGAMV